MTSKTSFDANGLRDNRLDAALLMALAVAGGPGLTRINK